MTHQELLARLRCVGREDFATITYDDAQALIDLLAMVGPISGPIRSLRLKVPGGICTQDFHPDRLNVHTDARHRIVKLSVG